MWVVFALQELLTFFFQQTFQHIRVPLDVNFNESLTNDIVSFEQLGHVCLLLKLHAGGSRCRLYDGSDFKTIY